MRVCGPVTAEGQVDPRWGFVSRSPAWSTATMA
jgi:hypothetical protein